MPSPKSGFRLAVTMYASAVAVGLLVGGRQAQGHLFCVTTASELQSALTDSSAGGMYNGEDNDIYIAPGTYTTGTATANEPFTFTSSAANSIVIQGALADCAQYPVVNASMVVLDGNNATPGARHREHSGFGLHRSDLTIQNGESSTSGAGLAVNFDSSGNPLGTNNYVSLYNAIIRNNHTTSSCAGVASDAGAQTQLTYDVIAGNSADDGAGAGCLIGLNTVFLENNTITHNTTTLTNGTGGISISVGNGHFTSLKNNILWNNTNYGAYFFSAAKLDFNDYGTLGGVTPTSNTNSFSSEPDFVNAAGGNFHLTGDSQLLGISTFFPETCCDVEGDGIPQAGRLDLGAYEETVFTGGFEGN